MTDHDENGITFTDRRRFNDDGTVKPDAADKKEEPKAADAPAIDIKEDVSPKGGHGPVPEMNFTMFILSLATSAQVHLGKIPNPGTKCVEKDLTLAKQTIDILGMLAEKTKNNLSQEEDRLIQYVLYDLRLLYVEASK